MPGSTAAATNYAGGLMENDTYEVHGALGKNHFEEFKRLLKRSGIAYESFQERKGAQILDIKENGSVKLRVYFTGGTTWWGFQKGAARRMQEKQDRASCVLLIYADVMDKHYWWIDLKDGTSGEETGRWMFSEPSKGKLQCPPELKSFRKFDQDTLISKLKRGSHAI